MKYHIVTSDIFSSSDEEEDIGLIAVEDNYEAKEHHWVTFPDKTNRRMYNSRKIDSVEHDLFYAFDILPVLKVSYRPISQFFNEGSEYAAMFIVLMGAISLILGLGFVFVNQIDGLMNTILNNPYVSKALTSLAIGIPLSICFLITVIIAENRWIRITKHDVSINLRGEAYRNQQVKEEKEAEEAAWRGKYLV